MKKQIWLNKFVTQKDDSIYQSAPFCTASRLSCKRLHNKFDKLWAYGLAKVVLNKSYFCILIQYTIKVSIV